MAELENRYVVIKLSKLFTHHKEELAGLIKHLPESSLVHCVVVEKDWPMYDSTIQSVLKYDEEQKANKSKASCKYCEGTGQILIAEGHDCWGKPDNTYIVCPVCKGNGLHNEERYQWVLERDALDKKLF